MDFTKFLREKIPKEIGDEKTHFSIELSIVMKKPKGHPSRAPGLIWEILDAFDGGTFFQGQGYWKGIQEPIIYIMISINDDVKTVIEKLKPLLEKCQNKLMQQEVFVKINGFSFIDSLLPEFVTKTFPTQWDFDDDMQEITANQSRIDEHHKLIAGRVEYQRKKYNSARDVWIEMINQFAENRELSQNQKRDLVKCYSNILSPNIDLEKSSRDWMISQWIKLLPFSKDSEFDQKVLSKHAEARMRGNRIKLLTLHNYKIGKEELISDGVFAIEQIIFHLKKGLKLYLDKDPFDDIKTIMKHLKSIEIGEVQKSKIETMIEDLATELPIYKNEILNLNFNQFSNN